MHCSLGDAYKYKAKIAMGVSRLVQWSQSPVTTAAYLSVYNGLLCRSPGAASCKLCMPRASLSSVQLAMRATPSGARGCSMQVGLQASPSREHYEVCVQYCAMRRSTYLFGNAT
jgi:hypothetical protein